MTAENSDETPLDRATAPVESEPAHGWERGPDSPPALALDELQSAVDGWIAQFEEGYFPPLANLARLSEEVGELARAVSHHEGFKKPKPGEALGSISEELGDILFVVVCLANQLDLDLSDAVEGVLEKIDARDRSRWTLKPEHRDE